MWNSRWNNWRKFPPQTDAQVQCSENGGSCPTTADAQVQCLEVAEEREKKEEARGGEGGG